MNQVLFYSGVIAWLGVAAVVPLLVVWLVLRRRSVRLWMNGPSVAPYSWFVKHRTRGLMLTILRRIGLVSRTAAPPEVIEAHRSVSLPEMRELRDAYQEMDQLPTIVAGKAALNLKSVFEIPVRRVHRIASPYTHPMQYPPFYLPGVPARSFYDPSEFEWAKALEDAFPVIKDELMQVLASDGAGFRAYVAENQKRLAGWNTFDLFFYGKKFEENCARVPRTMAILESLPRFERDHIMFSALNPHARIAPHVGPMNGIIRAHLPLVVPEGCFIRVGPDERTWREGKLLVFDDSFEHEVFNHGDGVRIVLFMNFWHPCFKAEEIPVLERFRAAYEKSPLSRVHERNQTALRGHDMAAAKVAAKVAAPVA